MTLEDALGLAVPATFLFMLAVEKLRPARTFPEITAWSAIGTGFFVAIMTVGVVLPMLLPLEWMAAHRLVDGSRLGVAGGVVVGYATFTLATYAYHRASHSFSFMWRALHQMHHAPQRLDIPGAMVFHPLDMVMQVVIQLGVFVFVLGLDPLAAALAGYVAAFYALFQHWNIRTPRWLGYVIQRPEQHGLHHELEVHARNYSDLPIWDIVFGTFENPATFEGRVGFAEKASFARMLVGVDVNARPQVRREETVAGAA